MLTAARYTFFAAFIAALVWVFARPGYDSAAAAFAAFAAFVGSFFLTSGRKRATQSQDVQKGFGVQAGRDANVRDIRQ